MAFTLPPAPRRYQQDNENQSRRVVERAFDDVFARLEAAEAAIAAGGVAGAPTADFLFNADGLSVSFTDASAAAGAATITGWSWAFGDSDLSTQQNPSHVYAAPGDYTVTLTVTDSNGLQNTTQKIVTVAAAVGPTADFSFTPDFLVVDFQDASTEGDAAITARDWDYGDGTSSTVPNNPTPTHTYPDAGDYLVTLTVTDANGLQDEVTKQVSVEEDSPTDPQGAPTMLVWGTEVRDMPAKYDWWNGMQAATMTENNCKAMLDAFADAGVKCFVKLWRHNFVKDANGNFSIPLWKQEIDRYFNNAEARAAIIQRSQDGTIIHHSIMDDILSDRIWGDPAPIQGAELDELASHSRQRFPDLETNVRARVFQIGNFNYQHLQGVSLSYLFGRGGVSQGTKTLDEWRRADAAAYVQQEKDDLAASLTPNLKLVFGLNVVNGGDGTSGWPGDGTPANKWAMGADELRAYADEIVPHTTDMFFQWERGVDGDQDAYYDDPDIEAAFRYMRDLCDAQGI